VKKSRFTEPQIVGILKELDAGTTATELGQGRRTLYYRRNPNRMIRC
jgi:hypothetical protein